MMAIGLLSFFAMVAVSLLLDAAVRPRRRAGRRWPGAVLHGVVMAALFGLFLAGSGNAPVAALLAVVVAALLMIVSNAKYAMLGEPLLFSDLALIVWVFRHPRFYFTALTARQRWMLALGTPVFLVMLVAAFVPRWCPHLVGAGLFVGACASAWLSARSFASWVLRPDIEADLSRWGLSATLLLYWMRWRQNRDPGPCEPAGEMASEAPELIVIVQCESFADPVALTGNAELALPRLAQARADAWQWGDLRVSGFGAYTMRSEYGVLFGRGEAELDFRRYDPFLTALGETSYALPHRLAASGYRSLFVHPHDMRFYGRDRLMPRAGFERLVGEESFSPIRVGGGRYVADRELGAALVNLLEDAAGRTLIYSVTMENHGPWIRDPKTGSHGGLPAYLHHLDNSDAMLSSLIDAISNLGRRSLLVFFGDHRPSIPGTTDPGGERHTPYVVMRFSADGRPIRRPEKRIDITPAELHHVVLDCVFADGA